MDITPQISNQSKVIQSYKNGQFKVSGETHKGNVLVFSQQVMDWTSSKALDDLSIEDFDQIVTAKQQGLFDVLLIGSGDDFKFLAPELKAYLQKHGIAPEMMNTGAACRTFNVLLSEGRNVCAALCAA